MAFGKMDDTVKVERIVRTVSGLAATDARSTVESGVAAHVAQTASEEMEGPLGKVSTEEIYLEFQSDEDIQAGDLATVTSRTGNPEYRLRSVVEFKRHSFQCRGERQLPVAES